LIRKHARHCNFVSAAMEVTWGSVMAENSIHDSDAQHRDTYVVLAGLSWLGVSSCASSSLEKPGTASRYSRVCVCQPVADTSWM
jgi:hypothetical protein